MRGLALLGAMIAFASVVYADTYTYFFGQEKIDMPSAGGYFARYWLFGLLALSSIAIAVWWGAKRWGILRCLACLATILFVALLALFLITLAGFHFGYADTLAGFFGHKKTDGLSAGGHFARNLGFALLALGGIAMAAWRNREMSRQADAALNQSRASEKQADAVQKQIENESKRIAGERFSDGVKMLAQNSKNNKPAIAARIGGIYALQSLANNYISQYAAQVVKTLVAYVRENVQLTKIPYEIPYENTDMDSENEYVEHMCFLGEDVKAAFAVLAQLLDERDKSREKKFELSDNDLDFSDCDFSRLFLNYKQVNGLWHYGWQGADLRGSNLYHADFRKARMYGARLQGANLRGANLEGARLHYADLRGACLGMGDNCAPINLRNAELRYVDLRGADLSCADLRWADLNDAKLQDTDLRGANLSDVQKLPELSPNQIWHDEPWLRVESIEVSPNRKWCLGPYLNCPHALAGVLRNYGNYKAIARFHIFTAPIPSDGLLKAARKLLDDNQLPPGFSEIWRKRLEEVDPETGDHPDWRE